MSKRVRATAKGYYGGMIRDEGATFDIASDVEFSENWMEYVEPVAAKKAAAPAPAEPAKKPVSDPVDRPKKYKFAPKAFKNDAGNREVLMEQALESAMLEFGKGQEAWNALPDGERKDRITRAANRLLQETLA